MIKEIMGIIRVVSAFFGEVLERRELIVSLATRNFKGAYFGSALGVAWAVVEPLVYTFLLWFFFTKALKYQPPEGHPYVPWLMSSMVLWNFFSLAVSSSTNIFRSYAFLLRRADFSMAVLPIVNILTALYVHAIFIVILIVILLSCGIPFSFYWFQSIYYLAGTIFLLLGLGWIIASLGIFVGDVRNIVGIFLQVGFWVSPIFWSLDTFPKKFHFLLELNPLAYVMEGYRRSFIYGEPFWLDVKGALYFWSVTFLVLIIGIIIYRSLRPSFGDVI